jgi:hypothetical protein
MTNDRVPLRVFRTFCLCISVLASACFGQNQSRFLAYSTYNSQVGYPYQAAVNAAGVLCEAIDNEVRELGSDGSLVYDKTVVGPIPQSVGIDAAGNCYVAA